MFIFLQYSAPDKYGMTEITTQLIDVKQRIRDAASTYGRDPDSIQLLAISKTRPSSDIEAAYRSGQRAFGENYLQDALPKIEALAHLEIEWHFIGAIQSNKTADIARHFSWVHTLEREKIARRLNDQRPAELPPLNVFIQVNISGEASKSGIKPTEVASLAAIIAELPNINLRGLMAIPSPETTFEAQSSNFKALFGLQTQLIEQGFQLDNLSIGMSNDLEAAVAEGATWLRIGSAIFGQRSPAKS